MAFRLLGEFEGRSFRLLVAEGESVLGTASDCDLVLNLPTISRHHARLRAVDDRLAIEDLGSSNGTRHEDRLISAPVELRDGDSVRLGDIDVMVQRLTDDDAAIGAALPNEQSGPLADDPRATIAPLMVDRFALGELPQLLRQLRAEAPGLDCIPMLGAALWRSMPLAGLQLLESDGPEAILFDAGSFSDQSPASLDVGPFRVILELDRARSSASASAVLNLAGALLELAPAAHSTPRIPQCKATNLPAPASLDADMQRIYARAARVAQSDLNVLIQGESGTGKELMARYIHDNSGVTGPFVAINCAALASDLLEAELFGIEKGIATGVEPRAGCFERAHGGTLFLDEIGDMAAETQARILRVLQEGEVTRVGGGAARPAKPRILSATNRNLRSMLGKETFRLDLLHRISGWEVELPPLRDRPADIAVLALFFLARYCGERNIRLRGISRRALDVLRTHTWPGNVRELQQEMHRVSVFLGDGDLLSSDDLSPSIRDFSAHFPASETLESRLAAAERSILKHALADSEGNVSLAAERLGMGRSTLYRRLDALGLDRPGR